MYSLTTPLETVKGIGPKLSEILAERELRTVKDLLLFVPLRYEDRSAKKLISELQLNELVTIEAEVTSASNFYKGRRSIQSATVKDATGRIKLMWFNNPHVIQKLVKGKTFSISGKVNDRGTMLQPTVETLSEDTIHTGRLVPIYSSISEIAPGSLRKILKHIIDHLTLGEDEIFQEVQSLKTSTFALPLNLHDALCQIHFPDTEDHVVQARERLALEEILVLIQRSHYLKDKWKAEGRAHSISVKKDVASLKLPFELTRAQHRCIAEIHADISSEVPMNRLLIGDVGSGKTAVAGAACTQVILNGHHAALVSPTQILAQQHYQTFQKLFPDLPVQLIMSGPKAGKEKIDTSQPTVFIGTHAILNKIEELQPALLIYDEQHRFGVRHRSVSQHMAIKPHLLTLSATPIPRTLMLTIFSHLHLSVIDELPAGRKPVKTWVTPEKKRTDAYHWIADQLKETHGQVLIVCPFIDPSKSEALENVAAANEMFEAVKSFFAPLSYTVGILHGRVPKKEQAEITTQLYNKEIDILVTTPIVEVGVDLPAASIIVIEGAERFGLASLHQLRGRVGRAGQEAYCLLFTNSKSEDTKERLKKFCETHDGVKLAEQDLERRGAGDIFGVQQHGFDQLRFATWTNVELIHLAQEIFKKLEEEKKEWKPLFMPQEADEEILPLAN
jgi:ATP-dependent DNA helicase RecG